MSGQLYGMSTHKGRKEQTTTVEEANRFTAEYFALFSHQGDVATYSQEKCFPSLVSSTAFNIKMNDVIMVKSWDPLKTFVGLDRFQSQELTMGFACFNGMYRDTRVAFFGLANTEAREEDGDMTQRSLAVISGTGTITVPSHNTRSIDRNRRIAARKPNDKEISRCTGQRLTPVIDQMDFNEWATLYDMNIAFSEEFEAEMSQYESEDERVHQAILWLRRQMDIVKKADAIRIPQEGEYELTEESASREPKPYNVEMPENQRTPQLLLEAYNKDIEDIYNKHLQFFDSVTREREILVLYHYTFDVLSRINRGNKHILLHNITLNSAMLHGLCFIAISSHNCMCSNFVGWSISSASPGDKLDVMLRAF